HAYSHSATVGKRYHQPLPRSCSFSFLRNSCASSHDTCSTGNRFNSSSEMYRTLLLPFPWREKKLGLWPMTACHCPCVTAWTAISKSSLISVCTPFFSPSQPM